MKKFFLVLILSSLFLAGCTPSTAENNNGRIKVVASTTMLADLVSIIGQDAVDVVMLFGPEVDPHLALPTGSDTRAIEEADLVFFNGLDLEIQFNQILEAFADKTVLVAERLDQRQLITIIEDDEEVLDPHIWFSVPLWMDVAHIVATELSRVAPEKAELFESNLAVYLLELEALHEWIIEQVNTLDVSQRVLVTPHDAFNYFANEYGFKVAAIGGLSTEAEISVDDITRVANTIIEYGVNAIFVESSVPQSSVDAVVAQVQRLGFDVLIGEELFADALGEGDLASYINAMKHNVTSIVSALSS